AAARERAARVAGGRDVDGLGVDPGLAGGGQRVPDGGDLRVGEDHARAERAVGRREPLHALAGDVVGDQRRLVLAHVRELGDAVDVAYRIQPRVAGRAQRVVDLDRPDRLVAEA